MNKRSFLKLVLLTTVGGIGVAEPALAAKPVIAAITEQDVLQAQQAWAQGIVEIGKVYQDGGDYKAAASKLLDQLYGYGHGKVLFKPTKAAYDQFRETKAEAMSYFVGGENPEDHGFALQPWSAVRFENNGIVIDADADTAEAMGNYFFTDAKTGNEVKVEYTFAYKRLKDGRVVIFLHHSSLPYQPVAH
ncbi:MAG: hypothetical protein B7Y40_06660 [Gammaproteobacteria bacterium 28-57-27]|nr:MAG: hypothetical protein B7Y40_06660 [Gammaproteobacteria bacterium 28-57-27]